MELINQLKKRLKEKLPAEIAHAAVMSYKRKTPDQIKSERREVKESAVLCLLEKKGDSWFFYLMERNVYGGVHSGQISLPGGKTESEDADFEATALRETYEELGIPKESIEILGELSALYIPPSNFLVYPFVGVAIDKIELNPSPEEVNTVLKANLKELLSDKAISKSPVKMSGNNAVMKVNHFSVEGHIVWGATAMIIAELIYLLKELGFKSEDL